MLEAPDNQAFDFRRSAPECWGSSLTYWNLKSDVWSFGVALWELANSGEQPSYAWGRDSKRIPTSLEQKKIECN
eukprot:TRINITY_DN9439_c0_g1_i1.p1 TRINITY_DN9439_c0_g1~~TRINITY_DN9439_c0_g1_i1.p1  ORF type:complete len:74 (-),score=13.21 TRINITY_DN9439_c0_g1_i1:147-368(-)